MNTAGNQDAADRFWRYVMNRSYHELPQGADLTPLEIDRLRDVRRTDQTEAIRLNQGTPYEEPFGPTLAAAWAERLCRERLLLSEAGVL